MRAGRWEPTVSVANCNPPAISIDDASPRSLSPNDYVLVRFYDDYTYGLETIVNKGTSIYVPALTLWAMVQEKSARDLSFGFKAVGFFISLPFALEGGTSGTLATIDALFLGADIATTDTGWRNKVTSNEGKEVLRLYDALETAYFTAQTVYALKNGLSSLSDALTRWKNTTRSADEIAAIDGNVGKIVVETEKGGSVATITNPKNIREAVKDWAKIKQDRFNLSDDFYKKGGAEDYDNELRGIDFDKPVQKTTIQKDEYLYQYCKRDDNDVPIIGQYFYKSEGINPNKLGFDTTGRTLVKFKVTQSTEFLESNAATIDDWNSSTKIFSGGEIQLFNKNAKSVVTIVSF